MSGHHCSGDFSRLRQESVSMPIVIYLFWGFVVIVVLFLSLFPSYTVKSPLKNENLKHADMA